MRDITPAASLTRIRSISLLVSKTTCCLNQLSHDLQRPELSENEYVPDLVRSIEDTQSRLIEFQTVHCAVLPLIRYSEGPLGDISVLNLTPEYSSASSRNSATSERDLSIESAPGLGCINDIPPDSGSTSGHSRNSSATCNTTEVPNNSTGICETLRFPSRSSQRHSENPFWFQRRPPEVLYKRNKDFVLPPSKRTLFAPQIIDISGADFRKDNSQTTNYQAPKPAENSIQAALHVSCCVSKFQRGAIRPNKQSPVEGNRIQRVPRDHNTGSFINHNRFDRDQVNIIGFVSDEQNHSNVIQPLNDPLPENTEASAPSEVSSSLQMAVPDADLEEQRGSNLIPDPSGPEKPNVSSETAQISSTRKSNIRELHEKQPTSINDGPDSSAQKLRKIVTPTRNSISGRNVFDENISGRKLQWQSDDDTPGIDFSMAYQGSGSSGSMAKGRRRWTRDEELELVGLVNEYGISSWKHIAAKASFGKIRTNVNIKDKFRNLVEGRHLAVTENGVYYLWSRGDPQEHLVVEKSCA